MNLSEKLAQLKGKDSYRSMSDKTKISHNYLRYLIKGFDPRTGKPIEPSTETLKKIAVAYSDRTTYTELLELAGYLNGNDTSSTSNNPADSSDSSDEKKLPQNVQTIAAHIDDDVSDEEMEEILNFIEYVKAKYAKED